MNVTSEHYFMNVSFISDVPQKSDPADAAVWLDGDPDVRQLPVRLDLGHEEVVAVRTQLLRLQDLDRPGLGHLQRSGGLRFESELSPDFPCERIGFDETPDSGDDVGTLFPFPAEIRKFPMESTDSIFFSSRVGFAPPVNLNFPMLTYF